MTLSTTLSVLLLSSVAFAPQASRIEPASPQEPPVVLAGDVRADGFRSDGRLIGAIVELHQGSLVRWTTVDANGRYRFEDLRPGPGELKVHHVAAEAFETRLELPGLGTVELDLSLMYRAIELPPIAVRAVPRVSAPIEPIGRGASPGVELGLRSLDSSSGMAESGLVAALSSDEPSDPEGVLYMRGSTMDARMILLDGAPILTPFHVAGLIEPFDPFLLGGTTMYLGGAPTPYAGSVSYLLDVDTRPARADGPHGSFAIDGLSGRGAVEVPLPWNGGLIAGSRGLHGAQASLGTDERFPYLYRDFVLRAGVVPVEGHLVRLTAFDNEEGVRIDMGLPGEGELASASQQDAVWGNRALSMGYEGRIGGASVRAVAATSRYESALPLNWTDPVLAEGTGDRARGLFELAVPVGPGILRVGGSVERMEYGYRLRHLAVSDLSDVPGEELGLHTTASGVFAEWDGSPVDRFELRAGFRADRYSHERELYLSPRLSFAFAFADGARLHGSAGGYHQALPSPGLRGESAHGDSPAALDWDPTLPVIRATHLLLGVDQEFEGGFGLGVAGFVKSFAGFDADPSDRTRSSGMELRLTREGERLRAWLGYALSWYWIDEGADGSSRFDGKHLLSIGADAELPGGIELTGRLGYGAGLPWTAVGLNGGQGPEGIDGLRSGAPTVNGLPQVAGSGGGAAPLDVAPEGDFLRVDLEVGWPVEPSIAGRTTRLRPYFKILNALDRRDALFYYFDQWQESSARPIAAREVLPLIGVEWRF